jgi:hypothetical protein
MAERPPAAALASAVAALLSADDEAVGMMQRLFSPSTRTRATHYRPCVVLPHMQSLGWRATAAAAATPPPQQQRQRSLSSTTSKPVVDILAAKRNGEALSSEDIHSFVKRFTAGEVADYQMSAWLMAVCLQGMDARETADLTLAMVQSGAVADLSVRAWPVRVSMRARQHPTHF